MASGTGSSSKGKLMPDSLFDSFGQELDLLNWGSSSEQQMLTRREFNNCRIERTVWFLKSISAVEEQFYSYPYKEPDYSIFLIDAELISIP
ncbi:hypothetical protein TNCV_973051 [Trichonephila clavipes]|nr:hypothetical protein TNCV_973051 [Trichonephila clavipes]